MDPKPIPPTREFTASDFLSETMTPTYSANSSSYGYETLNRLPPFNQNSIWWMQHDPKVTQGMGIIEGMMITHAKFEVATSRDDVRQFVLDQFDRFFLNSAIRALKAMRWGYSCGEVIYRQDTEQSNLVDPSQPFVSFDILKDFDSRDCRPQILNGKIVGAKIRPRYNAGPSAGGETYIGMPRMLWHTYGREFNPWFGRSRLKGAYPPFLKKWGDGGVSDTQLLFFKKYAYPGQMVWMNMIAGIPDQSTGPNGPTQSFKDKIRNTFDKLRTGGNVYLPRMYDANGRPSIEVEPVPIGTDPGPILDWGDRVDNEIFDGLGIPNEVVQAQVSGLGQGGRSVAMTSFLVTLQDPVNCLAYDFDTFVVRPMVEWNFGSNVQYDIIPKKLTDAAAEAEGNAPQGGMPEGVNPDDGAVGAPGDEQAQEGSSSPVDDGTASFSIPYTEMEVIRNEWGQVMGTKTKHIVPKRKVS